MERGGYIYKQVQHYDEPCGTHALTFSCFKRRPFLKSDRTRGYMADAINQARTKHGFHLWAYVFMPEHVHLLIWRPDGASSVRAILLSMKQSVARRALIYLRRNNPAGLRVLATGQKHTPYRFWLDGSGYDRTMDSRTALHNMVDYIHGNPVRRGLCLYSDDWKWSSAAEWAGMAPGPVPIDSDTFPS